MFSIRNVLPIAALALAVGACRCEDPPTDAIRPDVVPSPAALSFEACPSQDENGDAVEDVFADRKTITLTNQANIGAPLTLTLTGAGADRFTLVEPPEAISALGEVEVTVDFLPSAQGDTTATLEIEDGDPETDVVKVTLVGTGTNLPAQPTMQVSFESAPGTNEFEECEEGMLCSPTFPETRFGNTSALKVRVRNVGCPALKITGMQMDSANVGGGTTINFFLEDPVVPPSEENPILLTLADGTQELEALVRFEPSPDENGDGLRSALLRIQTNDPRKDLSEQNAGERTLSLYGTAVQPNLYATPSYCDFTNPDDTCGGTKVNTAGNNKAAVFRISNGGQSDVVIETVRLVGPHGNRFSIGEQNPQGMTITAGGEASLQIDYTDAPTYVTDFVEVIAADDMGDTRIRVSGGEQPKLTTDTEPSRELNFSSITEQSGTLPVEVCNEAGAGLLVLNGMGIAPANQTQFFKIPSAPPAGTELTGGSCTTVNVQFTRPVSGGLQAATLTIQSNDPRYSAGYGITLLSEAPLNQFPVAVLESLSGQTNQFALSLQQNTQKKVTLVGSNSYDPPNNDMVDAYQYFIMQKPNLAQTRLTAGAGSDIGDPNIDGVKGDYPQVTLHLDPARTGEYVIRLLVFDASGQQSPHTDLRILVNP